MFVFVMRIVLQLCFSVNQNRSHLRINERECYRQRKENHAMVQLTLVVGSFALGYIPMSGNSFLWQGLPD